RGRRARHDHPARHGPHPGTHRAGRRPARHLTRQAGRLDGGLDLGAEAAARGPSARLAGRRQDRHRRERGDQRHRRLLAAGRPAYRGRLLSHRHRRAARRARGGPRRGRLPGRPNPRERRLMADANVVPGQRPTPREMWGWVARGEVALALGVVGIIVLLILPIPAFLLDALLSLSITSAVLILMTALLMKR